MSEYLSYTLWRQQEQRLPHELERQRVVQERLDEQREERERERREKPIPVSVPTADASTAELVDPVDESAELEFVAR